MNHTISPFIYKIILICLFLTSNASYAFDFGKMTEGFKIKVNGEEVTTTSSQNPTTQQGNIRFNEITGTPVTRDNLNLAYLKLSGKKDIDSHKDELFEMFYHNEYNQYRNNEFQYEKQKNIAIKNIHTRAEKINTDNFYTILTTELDKYDFESKSFPLHIESFFSIPGGSGKALPSQYVTHISNDQFIEALSMPADEAETFLINRTPRDRVKNGSYNRKVTLLLHYGIDRIERNKEDSHIADLYVTVKSYKIFDGQKDATLKGLIASKP